MTVNSLTKSVRLIRAVNLAMAWSSVPRTWTRRTLDERSSTWLKPVTNRRILAVASCALLYAALGSASVRITASDTTAMSGSTLRTAVADNASSRFSVAILLFLEAFLGAGGLGSAIESKQLQTATVEKQRSGFGK